MFAGLRFINLSYHCGYWADMRKLTDELSQTSHFQLLGSARLFPNKSLGCSSHVFQAALSYKARLKGMKHSK
jgi:hypothetical protein